MKKIIAAFDGLKYSDSTQSYAIDIAKHSRAHLVGIFLNDFTYTSYKIYNLIVNDGVSQSKLKQYEAKDKAKRDVAASKFEKACQKAKLEYSVHNDKNIAIQEIKHESIYADLLIVNVSETLTHYTEKLPTQFIRDLLTDAQCPVLITSQKYKPIQKVVLLYDGEPSSVHAIKMFSYLLPQLKDLETEVVVVNPMINNLHVPDNRIMKEFMKRHYPKAKYIVLKGFADELIKNYLKEQKENTLVVLGAYRRGAVSRWFKESMADTLMRELKVPLFIAHNK
jgi:nucleotide-binding universal stress UspA family protein